MDGEISLSGNNIKREGGARELFFVFSISLHRTRNERIERSLLALDTFIDLAR